MAAISPTVMTVKLLGFRPSSSKFPIPAEIRCTNLKMHVPFLRKSTNPRHNGANCRSTSNFQL
ncbi:hypothetical protein Hdeb2414_s0001g00015661 [Helianthus debilis subsp. tardiflorus]